MRTFEVSSHTSHLKRHVQPVASGGARPGSGPNTLATPAWSDSQTHARGEKPGNVGQAEANMQPSQSLQTMAERFPAEEEREVAFTVYAPEARVVQVAGSFNGWQPMANPMEHTRSGDWLIRLMLRSGQYEYRFVIDGVWTDDPLALKSAINPFGGLNSVLTVAPHDRTGLL